jgi:hypothetical protein
MFGHQIFIQYPNAPIQGLDGFMINQSFCKNVVNEIITKLYLQSELLVLENYNSQKEGEVYADIIIGHKNYHQELINGDLSKGLGWKVKNDLNNSSKVKEGKGQLLKYARIYLTTGRPLTHVFYGCLTDGSLWKFTKIQFLYDDDGNPKVKYEENPFYQWNEHTASLIASLISCYYDDLIKRKMSMYSNISRSVYFILNY